MIEIRNLTHEYDKGVRALDSIDLTISAGESVAVLGPNGAGKTTLMQHFNGLLRPTSGEVLLDGTDTKATPVHELAQSVGYMFQNPDNQIHQSPVRREVAFGPTSLGLEQERVRTLVEAALEGTGLSDLAEADPHDLPRALRKMVTLAGVLAMDCRMVLMDEPTAGQDGPGMARIEAVIADLTREGKAVVAVSHDLDFCAAHFRRMVVMDQGRIVADGSPEELFFDPDSPASRLLGQPTAIRLGRALNLAEPTANTDSFLEQLVTRKRMGNVA